MVFFVSVVCLFTLKVSSHVGWWVVVCLYLWARGLALSARGLHAWFALRCVLVSSVAKSFPHNEWCTTGFIFRRAGHPTNARICHTLRAPWDSLPILFALLSLFIDRHFTWVSGGRKTKTQTYTHNVCLKWEPVSGAFNPSSYLACGLARLEGERVLQIILTAQKHSKHTLQMSKRKEWGNLRQNILEWR